MAGGAYVVADNKIKDYPGRLTWRVFIVCLFACQGGMLFGFDNGITGGVTSMPAFLAKFFPDVYHHTQNPGHGDSAYCKYNNQGLQLFTSCLFIAAAFSSLVGGYTTRALGRRRTMTIGGLLFIIGAALQAGAVHLAMLIVGRVMLGFGVGLANQSVPMYLSEIAPPKLRGALNFMFQLATTSGILIAQLVNYGTSRIHEWGWRLSVGLAAVPAIVLLIGSLLLPETPNSLIERGHNEKALQVLRSVRGTQNVQLEYDDIMAASKVAAQVKNPWRTIFSRRYVPELMTALLIPIFQQLTGINAVVFYAPVLFSSLGMGQDAALLSSVITGAVFVAATIISILTVDTFGRRALFIQGGIQMIVSEIVVAILLAVQFNAHSGEGISPPIGVAVIVFICLFVAGFGWSWGPLGWLVPNEIQPLETRSAGQSLATSANMLLTFVIGQSFLSMLCTMQYGIMLFFAAWCLIMTLYIILCLPETKGVPIEEIVVVWRKHWLWKHFVQPAAIDMNGGAAAGGKQAPSSYAGAEQEMQPRKLSNV
ncbi:g6772 [Coccomyxa viridis]|uniref:G6772 protein n=1 Tax=Coccomyxa viridis TaxID=1274662 RepID=A0ABP1FW59_9CHLO